MKIRLSGGFQPLEEGNYVFKISAVEYNEEFGTMNITLETKDGKKLFNKFNFGANGENEKGINAFSYFARQVLNDVTLTEIDHEDILGKFVRGDCVHSESNGKTYANFKNPEYASGWETSVNLDDIIDDAEDLPFDVNSIL